MIDEQKTDLQGQISATSTEVISAEAAKSIQGYLPLICDIMLECKSAALTFGAILFHIDRDGISTRKSAGYFAKMLGNSLLTSRKHLRTLESLGYLRRTGKIGKSPTTVLMKPRSAFLGDSSSTWLPLPLYAIDEAYGLNWASLATLAALVFKGQDTRDHAPENWCGPSELSRLIGVTTRSITSAYGSLESAGLIMRSGGGNGKHSKTVLLQPPPVKKICPSDQPMKKVSPSAEPPKKVSLGTEIARSEPMKKVSPNIEETINPNQQGEVVVIENGLKTEAAEWIANHKHAKSLIAFDDPAMIAGIWHCANAGAVSVAFTRTAISAVIQSMSDDSIRQNSKWVYWKVEQSFPLSDIETLQRHVAAARSVAGEILSEAMLALWPKCKQCNATFDPDSNARFVGFCSARCNDDFSIAKKSISQTKSQEEIEAQQREWELEIEQKAKEGCQFSRERLARSRRKKSPPK